MASKTASGMAGENGSVAKGRRDPVDGEVQQEQQPFSWSDMNLRQKTKHAVANITVEPITLMYVVPNLLSSLTTQNLNLDKACRVNHNLSTELCDSFLSRDNFTEESDLEFTKVAQTVAAMQVWQAPLQNIIPIVLVLFAGSWSDRRRRRKPFILLPVFGDLLMAIGLLFCSIFFSVPLEVAGVIEAIFPALSGGLTILLLSVFSYIADVTTEDTRTFRIGLVATAVSWGAPVAIALSGIAFNNLGFTGVYILDIVIYGLALAYGVSYVKEPFPPVSRPAGVSFLGDFCNWRHVWETAKVVLRKRAGSRQLQFFLIVLLYVTIQGPLQGESAVSFLFVTTRFKWDAIQYSAYGTYSIILLAVGNFVVITVLSRWLKLHDCTIGMIAMAAKTLSSPLYAFSTKDWELYAVTVADVLGAGAVIAMRSIATKLVSNDEVGKLMALLAVVEAIIPVIFKPIYSEVYRVSSSGHSGSFYHISAAVCLAGFFLFFFIFRLQKKDGDEGDEAAQVADGGVTNTAFQGDVELATKVSNGNGVDNTAL